MSPAFLLALSIAVICAAKNAACDSRTTRYIWNSRKRGRRIARISWVTARRGSPARRVRPRRSERDRKEASGLDDLRDGAPELFERRTRRRPRPRRTAPRGSGRFPQRARRRSRPGPFAPRGSRPDGAARSRSPSSSSTTHVLDAARFRLAQEHSYGPVHVRVEAAGEALVAAHDEENDVLLLARREKRMERRRSSLGGMRDATERRIASSVVA